MASRNAGTVPVASTGVVYGLVGVEADRAGIVSALDARAGRWWTRLGFHPFDPDDPADPDLYLLTSEIEATLRDLE